MGSVSDQIAAVQSLPKARVSATAWCALLACIASPLAASAAGRTPPPAKPVIAQPQKTQIPRTVLVSIRKQRLRLLDGDREIASTRISSGQPGFDTPTGVFAILEKNVYHESNIYDGAPMPFMQRITWSGIAMHAGVVPGYRASHGCVRLPYSFAKSFFQQTDIGGRVIVTQDEVSPVRFEHSALIKPLPENDPPGGGEAKIAANDVTAAERAALTSLVGSANAAPASQGSAAAGSHPRSRTEATRRFNERLESLQAAMTAANDAKTAASEKAKAAVRSAQDAESRLNEVRRPFESDLRAAANAEAARTQAAAAYRNFLNGGSLSQSESKAATADRKGKRGKDRDDKDEASAEAERASASLSPEDREQDLEDRLADAVVDAANARNAAAAGELTIADAKAAFIKADADRQQSLDQVRDAVIELRRSQTALVDAKAEAVRRARPLSIFISLKAQRIYIRQGFEPVFEAPIEVDDPGTVGTHVLTALGYDSSGDNFVWQLVTAQQPRLATNADDRPGKKKREGQQVAVGSPMNVEAATAALDSVRIPQDVQEQIAELARPGTSLIISEKPLSHETGKGTEFVILTR